MGFKKDSAQIVSTRRTGLGASVFATAALAAATLSLTGLGAGSSAEHFVAGPLEETWDYLVELFRMMTGI